MLNLTRLHLGIAHESQFQGLGITSSASSTRTPWIIVIARPDLRRAPCAPGSPGSADFCCCRRSKGRALEERAPSQHADGGTGDGTAAVRAHRTAALGAGLR